MKFGLVEVMPGVAFEITATVAEEQPDPDELVVELTAELVGVQDDH